MAESEDIMEINKEAFKIAMQQTKRQNNLEEQIAIEWYGCSYDELDYDDRELVTFEAADRMH